MEFINKNKSDIHELLQCCKKAANITATKLALTNTKIKDLTKAFNTVLETKYEEMESLEQKLKEQQLRMDELANKVNDIVTQSSSNTTRSMVDRSTMTVQNNLCAVVKKRTTKVYNDCATKRTRVESVNDNKSSGEKMHTSSDETILSDSNVSIAYPKQTTTDSSTERVIPENIKTVIDKVVSEKMGKYVSIDGEMYLKFAWNKLKRSMKNNVPKWSYESLTTIYGRAQQMKNTRYVCIKSVYCAER